MPPRRYIQKPNGQMAGSIGAGTQGPSPIPTPPRLFPVPLEDAGTSETLTREEILRQTVGNWIDSVPTDAIAIDAYCTLLAKDLRSDQGSMQLAWVTAMHEPRIETLPELKSENQYRFIAQLKNKSYVGTATDMETLQLLNAFENQASLARLRARQAVGTIEIDPNEAIHQYFSSGPRSLIQRMVYDREEKSLTVELQESRTPGGRDRDERVYYYRNVDEEIFQQFTKVRNINRLFSAVLSPHQHEDSLHNVNIDSLHYAIARANYLHPLGPIIGPVPGTFADVPQA